MLRSAHSRPRCRDDREPATLPVDAAERCQLDALVGYLCVIVRPSGPVHGRRKSELGAGAMGRVRAATRPGRDDRDGDGGHERDRAAGGRGCAAGAQL
jgi:hypothetical protein